MHVNKKKQTKRIGAEGRLVVGGVDMRWIVIETNLFTDRLTTHSKVASWVKGENRQGTRLVLYHVLTDDGYASVHALIQCILHSTKCPHTRANSPGVQKFASSVQPFMVTRYVRELCM